METTPVERRIPAFLPFLLGSGFGLLGSQSFLLLRHLPVVASLEATAAQSHLSPSPSPSPSVWTYLRRRSDHRSSLLPLGLAPVVSQQQSANPLSVGSNPTRSASRFELPSPGRFHRPRHQSSQGQGETEVRRFHSSQPNASNGVIYGRNHVHRLLKRCGSGFDYSHHSSPSPTRCLTLEELGSDRETVSANPTKKINGPHFPPCLVLPKTRINENPHFLFFLAVPFSRFLLFPFQNSVSFFKKLLCKY